jgi:hypothetical protein
MANPASVAAARTLSSSMREPENPPPNCLRRQVAMATTSRCAARNLAIGAMARSGLSLGPRQSRRNSRNCDSGRAASARESSSAMVLPQMATQMRPTRDRRIGGGRNGGGMRHAAIAAS